MSRFPAYPRSTALRSGSEGRRLFGGRKESSPQLRAPPRSFGVRPRTTPLLVFNIAFVVSLPLLDFSIARLRRRSSFSHGRPSGNVRGSNANALDPPSRSRASPPTKARRDRGRDSLVLRMRNILHFFDDNIFCLGKFFLEPLKKIYFL